MKRFFLIAMLILCFSNHGLYAWGGSIKLFVQDHIGRKDSVIIGVNDHSTLGIDSTLGERNIIDLAFDSLDVRVIQRDSTNQICGGSNYSSNNSPDLYYPANSDSKIDYRPFSGYDPLYYNFEIFINAIEFPITLIAEYSSTSGYPADLIADLFFLDSDCQIFKEDRTNPQKDTLAIVSNDSFTTLILDLNVEVGVKDHKKTSSSWKIFPNPTSSMLTISSENKMDGTFEIFDIKGKLLKNISVENENKINVNFQDMPRGIILINFLDRKTQLKTSKRIIKK
jgi:hypothetical protein